MKSWILVILVCSLPLLVRSEDSRTINEMRFHKSDVRAVLAYYQQLTGKPVLARIDSQVLVTIEQAKPITVEGAIGLIRKTLLERYGIELLTSESGETLANWSRDPKYPQRSDAPMTEAERNSLPKRTIRIIRP